MNKWISVDKKLPETDGLYLVSTNGAFSHVIDVAEFNASTKFFDIPSQVSAWMTLPDPYVKVNKPIKAWIVKDGKGEYEGTAIVFAETAGKARCYALRNIPAFEDYSWNDMRAKRFPELDSYYKGQPEANWYDLEMRAILVKEFGWHCIDPIKEACQTCPARGWCKDEH